MEKLLPFFERALEKMDEYVPDKYDSNAPLVFADFGNLQYASAPSVVENIR